MLGKRAIKQVLAAALVLAPPAALAMLIIKYSVNVPLWDEWEPDLAGIFGKYSAGHLTFADLLAQHNEARLFFPRLLFLGLGELTHWNVRYEMATAFIAAGLIALMICRLEAPMFQGRPVVRLLVLLLSSLLIFSPAYYEAWLWGIAMVCFLPLACITAGLLVARLPVSPAIRLVACATLSTVSTYSFANGFLAWIVLFPALFHRDSPARVSAQGMGCGVLGGQLRRQRSLVFLPLPETRPASPLPRALVGLLEQPLRTAQFFFSFLGSPLAGGTSHPQAAATAIGLVLIALFVGAGCLIFRSRADRNLVGQARPWLVIGGYAVLSAGLTTSTRFTQFGVAESLSSRYGIAALGLAVSVIHLAPLLAFQSLGRSASPQRQWWTQFGLAVPAAGLLLLHALALPAGAWAMRSTWEYRVLGKSCLAFINVIPEQRHLTELLCPNYDHLKRTANSLAELGLLIPPPFTEYPTNLFRCPLQAGEESLGRLETSRRISNTDILLAGWAVLPSRKREADGVLLTWEREGGEPRLFGLVGDRMQRGDLEIPLGKEPYYYAGWVKRFSLTNLPKESLVIKAWAYDAERQKAFLLDGAKAVDNR